MNKEEKEARYLINVLEDKKFTAQGEALRTYIEELNKKIDKLQEENEELENTLKQTQNSWFKDAERLDKLQKENKEYQELTDNLRGENAELRDDLDKLQKENEQKQETIDKIMKELEEFYKKYDIISKDKIKEALGDENIPDEMILTYIETLVSENNRLEDIEGRKVQIEYNNVFNKGVKSVKEKIKEALDYIEENSFEDTTGVVLNLKDESYWELWKLLKGDE